MHRLVFIRSLRLFLIGTFLSGSILVASEVNLKGQLFLIPGVENYRLLVKYRPASVPDVDYSGKLSFRRAPLKKSASASMAQNLKHLRSIPFTSAELSRIRSGSIPTPTRYGRFDILQFSGMMYVEISGADKFRLQAVGMELESLPEVEYCSLEPAQGAPPPVDLAPPTPDYNNQQGWLGPNPGSDCRYGWTQNALGQGITVRDIEDSWGNLTQGSTHEDFDGADVAYVLPAFNNTYDDHGLAIFGMIVGQHNGYGIMGCAPRAAARAYSFQRSGGSQDRPGTMVRMVADSRPGDIILLEMQAGSGNPNLNVPADYDVAIWDLTRQATTAGVVVVGTAGNGGTVGGVTRGGNLDSTVYSAYRARGDNGVIMEGAGTSNSSHTKLNYSTYGRCCVHVQGWGQNVVTTGYGSLADFTPADNRQSYSNNFSGTSSGGGHVAGVTAAVQSYAVQRLNRPLTSVQMRGLFIATGIRQGADSLTAHIGPLPNIRAALDSINRMTPTALEAGTNGDFGRWQLTRHGISGRVPGQDEFEINLTDVFGRTVHHSKAVPTSGRIGIQIREMPDGVYFLSIRCKGRRETFKQTLLP